MISQRDRIRYLAARFLGRRTARLDGFVLATDPEIIDRSVRRAIYLGTYEEQERDLIRRALVPTDRVLDLGACVGLSALLSASIVGGERVVSYEANPALEASIRKNFVLNKLAPDLRMRAITADGRDVTLFVSERCISSSLFPRDAKRSIVVPSDPIAVVLLQFRPTAVLMDIEGAEDEVLGATDFPGVEKLMIEFHAHVIGADAVARCQARLSGIGFRARETIADVTYYARA